jgi:hypothetical protein
MKRGLSVVLIGLFISRLGSVAFGGSKQSAVEGKLLFCLRPW